MDSISIKWIIYLYYANYILHNNWYISFINIENDEQKTILEFTTKRKVYEPNQKCRTFKTFEVKHEGKNMLYSVLPLVEKIRRR